MGSIKNSIWFSVFLTGGALMTLVGANSLTKEFSAYPSVANFWDNTIATTGITVKTKKVIPISRVLSGGSYRGSYVPSYVGTPLYNHVSTIHLTTLQGEMIEFKNENENDKYPILSVFHRT